MRNNTLGIDLQKFTDASTAVKSDLENVIAAFANTPAIGIYTTLSPSAPAKPLRIQSSLIVVSTTPTMTNTSGTASSNTESI